MRSIILFLAKVWFLSLLVGPAITLSIFYLIDRYAIPEPDTMLDDFLVLGFICGIAMLVILPLFFIALWQIRKLHLPWSVKIIIFFIVSFVITFIPLGIFSIIEGEDWGIYGFGISGWIIETAYLLTWLGCSLLLRDFFAHVEKVKRKNFGTLDEID